MPSPPPESSVPRPTLRPALLALTAAAGWLISRVFVGLDFTDEMQYYGEIASLVRTGKFFHDDLFLQQLGYFWVYPLFKLHAAFFPDQHYLILFGRVSFLIAYALVGLLYWRCTAWHGGFSPAARLAGLAAFLAWIPFQLFAFAYNSLAYLLIVSLLALWLARARIRFPIYAAATAGLLTMLLPSYPPAGIVLTALAATECAWRLGLRRGVVVLALTAAGGLMAGAGIIGLHGIDFVADVRDSLHFSRGFSGGQLFGSVQQMSIWFAIAAASTLLIRRLVRRQPVPVAAGLAGPGRNLPVLLAAGAAVLMAGLCVNWRAGYFAPTLLVALLLLLALAVRPADDTTAAEFGLVGLLLGTVFAISGGDGILNFSTGMAPVIPFLVLLGTGWLAARGSDFLPAIIRHGAGPFLVVTLVGNGAIHPYREQIGWSGFQRVRGVPAFAGIWTSPTKTQALETVRQLSEHGALRGKRVLVAGPHAWIYFASGGEPTTPMFFMHYTAAREEQYAWMAERLFRHGEPNAIFLTNQVPAPIGQKIQEWASRGSQQRSVGIPTGFIRRYQRQMQYDLAGHMFLLTRAPPSP